MIQIQRKSLQIFTHIDRIPVQYKLRGGGTKKMHILKIARLPEKNIAFGIKFMHC